MIKLILFTSNNCPGCVPMKRKINNLVLEMPKSITTETVNIDDSDENLQKAMGYYVSSTPTLLIEIDGKIMDTMIGNVPVENIIKSISKIG